MGIANLKKLLEDERVWLVAARVEVLAGQDSHFEVNTEGDLIVSVLTLLHGVPIWANLDTLAGGSDGSGIWHVPDPGTEVMVGFDGGEFEGEAHIVSRTSGGLAPQGLGPGIVFILGTNIQARTPGGTAKKLAFKDELDDLRKYVNDQFSEATGHHHVVSGAATTTITTGAAGAGVTSPPTLPAPVPVGTSTFKSE